MIIGPTAPYQVAALVLAGIQAQLDDTSSEGSPGRVCVVNGMISWDNCCDKGGQLAIAMTRMYFSDEFPTEAIKTQSNNPAALFCVDYSAVIIRCAPSMSDSGQPPSCDSLDRSAQLVMADAWGLQVGAFCTLQDLIPAGIIDYVLRPLISAGPEGGCVGSELPFSVALDRS